MHIKTRCYSPNPLPLNIPTSHTLSLHVASLFLGITTLLSIPGNVCAEESFIQDPIPKEAPAPLRFKPLQTLPGEYIIKVANNAALDNLTQGTRQYVTARIDAPNLLSSNLEDASEEGSKLVTLYSAIAAAQDSRALLQRGYTAMAKKALRRVRPRSNSRQKGLSLVSDEFCKELMKRPGVESCSPNFVINASLTPDDSTYPFLWGMTSKYGCSADKAWDITTSSSDVVIAIIDSGVDYTHPDLKENIWVNPEETKNGKDDDGNGYIDDIHGINSVANTGDPKDDQGHGTHVAGTIGAKGGNKIGVAGVTWGVQIMPIKFLDNKGSGNLGAVLKAMAYIKAMKDRGVNIRVMNASWGGHETATELLNAMSKLNDSGIIVVAAAGNEKSNNDKKPIYPASYDLPNIVSVGSISAFKKLSSFSNYGNSVDITAPGDFILSTWKGGSYMPLSGTSMAAPHVAGALSLLFGQQPELSVSSAIEKLYSSANKEAKLKNKINGARSLNVAKLLQ
jgi:subtilisin family serine protease